MNKVLGPILILVGMVLVGLINFTFSGLLLNEPVYTDLRDGVIYSIPEKNFRYQDGRWYFKAISIYDSPILITDKTNLKIDKSRISR